MFIIIVNYVLYECSMLSIGYYSLMLCKFFKKCAPFLQPIRICLQSTFSSQPSTLKTKTASAFVQERANWNFQYNQLIWSNWRNQMNADQILKKTDACRSRLFLVSEMQSRDLFVAVSASFTPPRARMLTPPRSWGGRSSAVTWEQRGWEKVKSSHSAAAHSHIRENDKQG